MQHEERLEQLMREATERIQSVKTYSCIVLCQDRMGGTLRRQERIQSLFRAPRAVYLRWLSPYEGLQTSYVPERDGEAKFMARETGLKGMVGALSLTHDSPMVTSMYPHHFRTHETSIHFMVNLSNRLIAKARGIGKMRVARIEEVDDPWLKSRATLVETEMSKDPKDDLRWPRTELLFDAASKLPLHIRLHGFDGGLFGEYAFSEFKPNIELSDRAFELKKL